MSCHIIAAYSSIPFKEDCEVPMYPDGVRTSDIAAETVARMLSTMSLDPHCIDQVAFVSEGIGDYLYMDMSKAILKRIGGRLNGQVYTYDLLVGNNGTIGAIQLLCNQMASNTNIQYSVICSTLLWRHHSNNRRLGPATLGDGSGAILLGKSHLGSLFMGYSTIILSKYTMLSGFKIGGSKNEFTKKAVHGAEFKYDILSRVDWHSFVLDIIEAEKICIERTLMLTGIDATEIKYIGVSGFNNDIQTNMESLIPQGAIIITASNNDCFLGTVGPISIIDKFINADDIPKRSKMLIITCGIDAKVESCIIEK